MPTDDDFCDYVRARWPSLVRSAVLLGCSPADAEDLVQTTLARAYVAWGRVRAAARPDAYIYRSLLNQFREGRRRRWHDERPTETVEDRAQTGDVMADVDTADATRRALAMLSPEHRAVVVLRFYADLSELDTAAALGVPVGTVKSRTARALAKLAADEHILALASGSRR